MTATKPIRHAGEPSALAADAAAEVERARAAVEVTRRRVEAGDDIAASVACAEYRLLGAQRRLDALGSDR